MATTVCIPKGGSSDGLPGGALRGDQGDRPLLAGGLSQRRIAGGTGLSRVTVRRYIEAAEAAGLRPGGPEPSEEQLARRHRGRDRDDHRGHRGAARMGENDAIVTRFLDDAEFQQTASEVLAREIFAAVGEPVTQSNL